MNSEKTQRCKQILVVEDHPESAELLKMILEEENYCVECVETGRAALQVFTHNSTNEAQCFHPDVVVLDLRLPDMSGIELVEELQRTQASIPPVIVLSADPANSLIEAAHSIGAIAVRKPFDFDDLFSAIETALARTTFA
jgi:DNA-binding response OmpR family regulator